MNRNPTQKYSPGIFTKKQFCFLLLCQLLTLSCGNREDQRANAGVNPYPTVEVGRRTVENVLIYPARIEGTVNSEVRAKVSGYIQEVLVDEGQLAKQGQLLFQLETESLSQDAEAAKARVQIAQVEVDKLEPLVAKDIISPIQLETAKANLAQARSSYQSLMANIGYAKIRSPIEGVVGTINYRRGTLVSPQDPNALTTVSSIREVYAYFSMNEKEFIDFIRKNQNETLGEMAGALPPVELVLANGTVYEHPGKIETISGSVDPQSGTVRFRATFPNPGGLIRNGSSGSIRLTEILEDVLVVPALSTFEQQGKTFVYLVEEDTLKAKSIEVLAETKGLTVLKGLEEGDEILAEGVGKVRPGTKIVPRPTSIDSIVQSFEQVFK